MKRLIRKLFGIYLKARWVDITVSHSIGLEKNVLIDKDGLIITEISNSCGKDWYFWQKHNMKYISIDCAKKAAEKYFNVKIIEKNEE